MAKPGHRLQPIHGDRLVEAMAGRQAMLAFGAAGCSEWHRLESRLRSWRAEVTATCALFHVDLEANDTLVWDFGVNGAAVLFFRDGRLEAACDSPLAEATLDAFLVKVVQPLLMHQK